VRKEKGWMKLEAYFWVNLLKEWDE